MDPVDSKVLQRYIGTHLAYELKYLLVAATTWTAVEAEADRAPWPDHLVVMAMESAFVHTRTVAEFLRKQGGWKTRSPHEVPPLPCWKKYEQALHMKVLHPDPRRPYVPGACDGDDLKDQVLHLATEACRGWLAVASQSAMHEVSDTMVEALHSAISESHRVADRLKVHSPFRSMPGLG